MVFMMAVTFTALTMTIVNLTDSFVAGGLSLGIIVAVQDIKKLTEKVDTKSKKAA